MSSKLAGSHPLQLRALAPLLPLLPRLLLLCTCRPLAGWLEHRPLDGSDALLEAGRARPREARRGCESAGQRRLGQARLRVVEEGGAEAARQQLAARLAHLALPRGGRVAGALRSLAHGLQRESRQRKDGIGGDCPACPLPPAASRSSGGSVLRCRGVIMFLCACRLPSCTPQQWPSHRSTNQVTAGGLLHTQLSKDSSLFLRIAL